MSTAQSQLAAGAPAGAPCKACFSIHGAADPGMMPRVIGQLSKRGLTPARWHGALCGAADRELYIDLEMRGLDAGVAAQIANDMRQIWGVTQVLMTLDRAPVAG